LLLLLVAGGFVALEGTADLVGFLIFVAETVFSGLGFGSKRSLSIVDVAGVQVDVELTAARIESAVA